MSDARLTLDVEGPGPVIDRNIYGHFAEHLGRCIYEGIWVGEGSPIPNTRGIRNDVVAALRKLDVPVLRWPGGCFADEYHWRDGIGPRSERPRTINTHWGGVIETNEFGTHEFMDLCEAIGAAPYISGNLGSGTVREMAEWVEYLTSDADSTLASLRRRNGRERPWDVPYFGVGNENWACGGNMRPEFYADHYRRFATFLKSHGQNRLERIACGAAGDDVRWTEVVMERASRHMEGISLHWYTLPTGDWKEKGSATVFEEDEWHSTFARALRMEELVRLHGSAMDRHDPDGKVGLVVDEWGTWYDVEPGTNPSFLEQRSTLRDALVAALTLDVFNRHAARVRMANVAQMVNVLQALISTDRERMLLTPTYHTFEMYKVHQGATLVPIELETPEYSFRGISLPRLHGSASRDARGRLHVSLVNLDPRQATPLTISPVSGELRGRLLTASSMNAHNTFDEPSHVVPVPFDDHHRRGAGVALTVPAKSILVLELAAR